MPNLILYLTLILIPPIPGATIVKDFDLPINFYGSGHRGIDYLSKVNEPVLASADGYVSHQGLIANRWTISITHSQFRTTYEDRKSTRLNSSHSQQSRMPSSA